MIWLTHPTGNTFVRELLLGLENRGIDFVYNTTLGFSAESSRWLHLLPVALRTEAMRRSYHFPPAMLKARPWRELGRLAADKAGIHWMTRHETGPFSVDAVYQGLDRSVAGALTGSGKATLVYSYEDAAVNTFTAAREMGIPCYYELPIAYWQTSRRLLEQEAERLPDWEPTLMGTRDSRVKLERKTMEAELADVIICPSQFVQRSLPEELRKAKPCVVAEFGSPARTPTVAGRPRKQQGSLRVLFAGSLSQRKGLADVFTAIETLGRKDIELIVMGTPVASMEFYRSRCDNFTYEPPRSHAEVLKLMNSCDLLILPSIVEGRALVQQEAMSCGLPLIITPNTGGEDLIKEGETGFLVPIRSPELLAERISWCADHRLETEEMGRAAGRHAATFSWENYASKILEVITNFAERKHPEPKPPALV